MRETRPIHFSVDISDAEEEVMNTSRATYEIMKKVNLKLRKYAKDNMHVENASRLFDLTPLLDQIKDYPIFAKKVRPSRNMTKSLMVLFDYINGLFHELHLYGVVKVKTNYDEYLAYRITLAKVDRIMVLNATGYTYDTFKGKVVPQKRQADGSYVSTDNLKFN